MNTLVRIRENAKRIEHKNELSGHSWSTYGKTTGYEVVGPCGLISIHKKESAAIKARDDWQEFYTKYPLTPV